MKKGTFFTALLMLFSMKANAFQDSYQLGVEYVNYGNSYFQENANLPAVVGSVQFGLNEYFHVKGKVGVGIENDRIPYSDYLSFNTELKNFWGIEIGSTLLPEKSISPFLTVGYGDYQIRSSVYELSETDTINSIYVGFGLQLSYDSFNINFSKNEFIDLNSNELSSLSLNAALYF